MRRQRGQILPIVAILSTVLAGFVGLVIDVGGVTSGQEAAQAAADGAALGAASSIGQGATIATATGYAQSVLTNQGMPVSRLSLTFLDSTGAASSDPTTVATVGATVSYQRPSQFLAVLGVASTGVAAAAVGVMPGPGCGACLYGTGTALTLANNSRLTARNSGVFVNSGANQNIKVGSGAALAAQFVAVTVNRITNNGTITPAPIVKPAVGDPYATLPVPSVAGSATFLNTPASGSGTASPGVYSAIVVNGSYALTLNPGVYVFTAGILVSGTASLLGAGVTIYLACGGYPTACTSGQSGALLNLTGGTTNLTAANTGTYAGVLVFADRNNAATSALSGGTLTTSGALYAPAMTLNQSLTGVTVTLASQLLLAKLQVSGTVIVDLVPRLQ